MFNLRAHKAITKVLSHLQNATQKVIAFAIAVKSRNFALKRKRSQTRKTGCIYEKFARF
jgi:hypothetical protein